MSDKSATYKILRGRYPENESALLQEVSNASGFARDRSLDWMVVNYWNSRGLSIIGIEQKSNRQDWLKELKNPQKQESHFRFCDYFYLLTDKENVARLDEIPESWGWLEIKGTRIFENKKAPKQTPIEVTRSFLCAMMRRAANREGFIHQSEIEDRIKTAAERQVSITAREAERSIQDYQELCESVSAFEAASGISIKDSWRHDSKDIGNAVKLILNGGVPDRIKELSRLEQSAKRTLEAITAELKNIEQLKDLNPHTHE